MVEPTRCVYCGTRDATTQDHVPPKALFPKPRPDNMVTVPSCAQCNGGASDDDEYFRFMLATRADVFDNPSVKAVLPKIHRSLHKPAKGGFVTSILDATRELSLVSPQGLSLGKQMAFEVDLARLDRVVERTTLGLFYKSAGRRLHSCYSVRSFSESGLRDLDRETKANLQQRIIPALTSTSPTLIGDRVFKYWSYSTEDPDTTLWLLQFYEKVSFLAMTVQSGSTPSG